MALPQTGSQLSRTARTDQLVLDGLDGVNTAIAARIVKETTFIANIKQEIFNIIHGLHGCAQNAIEAGISPLQTTALIGDLNNLSRSLANVDPFGSTDPTNSFLQPLGNYATRALKRTSGMTAPAAATDIWPTRGGWRSKRHTKRRTGKRRQSHS